MKDMDDMEELYTEHAYYEHPTVTALKQAARDAFEIEDYGMLEISDHPPVEFIGRILGDSERAFALLEERFRALGYTPLLFEEKGRQKLQALPIVFDKKPGPPWVNAILFVITLLSVMFIAAMNATGPGEPVNLWRGWPAAATLMGILTAHELSHYFVARRYGSPVSLPYFVPMPFNILGTMGAVIVQRAPMRNRKALFDIGIAGPLGGLIVAVPLLWYGLSRSMVGLPSEFIQGGPDAALLQEGNSLLYYLSKLIIFGQSLPDASGRDVWLSPPSPGGSIAFAAWAGLLVTALNLFPIGQLDGGHVLYALLGKKAWHVARAFVGLLFGWGLFLMALADSVLDLPYSVREAGWMWVMWGGLNLLMRPEHPAPLDDITPLDPTRRLLGWVAIGIFILILVPIPMVIVPFK